MEPQQNENPEATMERHLVARSIAHGQVLRVLAYAAFKEDPSLRDLLLKTMDEELEKLDDSTVKRLAVKELRSIIG